MTIGLLGSSLIQAYWFNWSMRQQESRFDISVIEALNAVEERLTDLETRVPLDVLNSLNRAPSAMIQQEISQFKEEPSDRFAELIAANTVHGGKLKSQKMKRRHGSKIGLNGFILIYQCTQQSPGLPVPAIQ